jgi:putative transposase
MHCLWTLPPGDADFSLRWKVIKFAFARRLPATEPHAATQQRSNGVANGVSGNVAIGNT